MILFMNVFITNKHLNHYDRGGLPDYDRMDIFKYTLASYSIIPFTKCHFNIKLDQDFEQRRFELNDYIENLFGPKIYRLTTRFRCENQNQWLNEISNLPNKKEAIWFAANDDHVFIAPDLTCLNTCLEEFQKDPSPYKSIYYSHWIEPYRRAKLLHQQGKFQDFEILPSGVLRTQWDRKDSIQIVSQPLLEKWFTHENYGNDFLPRPDFGKSWNIEPFRMFIPYQELARHFDGASHLFDPQIVPPLIIPKGFFEETCHFPEGYRPRHSLPLFWKSKEVHFPKSDKHNLYYAAISWNQYRREMMLAPTNHSDFQILPDEEWLELSDI